MNVLVKDFLQELKKSWSRFLSILLIVALGCGFFAGVRATGNDMKNTLNGYFHDTNFMDMEIFSAYGLTEDDINEIKQIEGIQRVVPAYQADLLADVGGNSLVFRGHSYEENINDFEITSGRLPENPGECLIEDVKIDPRLDSRANISLGDKLLFSTGTKDKSINEVLKQEEYIVVGKVRSPLYISEDRPNSLIGSGRVNLYMILPKDEFALDFYSAAWIEAEGNIFNTFSSEFEQRGEKIENRLRKLADMRTPIRMEKILKEPKRKIDDAQTELDRGKTEGEQNLSDARVRIENGERELADAQAQYEKGREEFDANYDSASQKLRDAQKELINLEGQYNSAVRQFDNAVAEINDGRLKLEETRAYLDKVKAELDGAKKALDKLLSMKDLLSDVLANGNGYTPQQTQAAIDAVTAFDAGLGQAVALHLDAVQNGQPSPTITVIQGAIVQIQQDYDNGLAEYNAGLAALQQGEAEYAKAAQQLAQAEQQLAESAKQLEIFRKELVAGWDKYNQGILGLENARLKLDQAQSQIETGREELDRAREELAKGEIELANRIADGERELENARQKLADIKQASWEITSRQNMKDIKGFRDNAERIDSISTVFPVFFLVIAVLVCLTTMTRMVEDDRLQIGTLKAMGYHDISISMKYIVYAFLATLLGSIVGLAIGFQTFPRVIFSAYTTMMYQLPSIKISFHFWLSFWTVVIAVLVTTIATISVLVGSLRAQPASLLRPEAPKIGKRIFLERITFIWKRLSFSHKVTARNVFRYKKRMLMSIIGIAGCTALMLAGFALKDSIADIAPIQFNDIFHYDMMLVLNELENDFSSLETKAKDQDNSDKINNHMFLRMDNGNVKKDGVKKDVLISVTDNKQKLTEFVTMKDNKGNLIELNDSGVVITQKLAEDYKIKPGDNISVVLDDEAREVKVTGVMENFAFHYVYMSEKFYQQEFNKDMVYNRMLVSFDEQISDEEEKLIANSFIESDLVLTASLTTDIYKTMNDQLKSMDMVIFVLVTSAALLAFIVMYNLNNINIIERQREIATLKVLGFYDPETSAYVFRENMILALLGALVGLVLGIFLTKFVTRSAAIDEVMFIERIRFLSYLYSFGLTMLFTILVRFLMHYRLQKIDMIESLKSVD